MKKDKEQIILDIKNAKQALNLYSKYKDAGIADLISNYDTEFSYYELMSILYLLEKEQKEGKLAENDLIEEYETVLEQESILHHSKGEVFLWIIFITEYYRIKHNMTNREVEQLFFAYGIFELLGTIFPAAHTQSEKYAAAIIEEHINQTKQLNREIVQEFDGNEYGYEDCDILIVKRERKETKNED